ncbi:hypothetical protein AN944_02999 [Shewanella sp. P1-14-1]|uniref:DUF6161 domain-containing protein n=1 Tax=Shewanella sp. P1-14-1 TaxID=1723761 RepID=UPI0006D67A3B|nr:DUF6161 domain-containing protein [Shewanella sp. P1-14-1]KPZ69480.1 hypothetical protein AN944_02999 [Shewanella sp. P1-14-1]
MSEKEVEKLKRIQLKTESGTRWFDDPAKLLQWVQQQRALYSFHSNVSHRYGLQQIFQQFEQSWNSLKQQITNGLQRFQNVPSNYNKRVEDWVTQFQNQLANNVLFTTDAPFAEFLTRQANKRPELAVVAVAIFFDRNITNIDSYAIEGISQAQDYLNGNTQRDEDESMKLSSVIGRWDNELHECKDKWLKDFNNEVKTANQLNVKANELVERWEKNVIEQTVELEESKKQFKEKLVKTYDEARNDLERLTSTYDDKLALHASVKYWGIQQKQHEGKMKVFGITLVIAVLFVVIGLVIFSNNVLDQSFADIKISKLVTVAVLTTFGIWIVKILANIFMSHMHLSTDAQERRTMMHTYLALSRKGHGPKDEDKQLILQTLFRPSTSGMVKEDAGPTNLVDMVNRLASKKAG